MDIQKTERNLILTGVISTIVLAVINFLAKTPFKFVLSFVGLLAVLIAAKFVKKQFGVPIIFIRKGEKNIWGAAFGGLIGGIMGVYGATRSIAEIGFLEFGADLALITVYLTLALTLFMGTLLQDIEDGYIEAPN